MRKHKNSITRITLKHIQEKLKHIHKSVEKNSKDIGELKEQMAMGRGGLKVIAWVGGLVAAIVFGFIKFKEIL